MASRPWPTRRAALAAPLLAALSSALGQGSKRLPKVGLLRPGTPAAAEIYQAAFSAELERLGWVEHRDYLTEARFAYGDYARLEGLARELVARGVTLIQTSTEQAALVAHRVAPGLPIVVAVAADPIGMGYAQSLGHPGGSVTGLTWEQDVRITERHAQFLKEFVPELRRLGIVLDAGSLDLPRYLEAETIAARRMGIEVEVAEVSGRDGFRPAFASLAERKVQAVHVFGSPLVIVERTQIVALIREYKWPDIGIFPEAVEAGALMSYGVDIVDLWRRSAGYVDKILRGAKPGDLPFEQPTKYDFVLNLRRAKELGRQMPQSLLVQATRLIE